MTEREWHAVSDEAGRFLRTPGIAVREYHPLSAFDPELLAGLGWLKGRRPREWRADLYIPSANLLVEVDGGLHMKRGAGGGKHGTQADMDKYAVVSLLGYFLMRLSSQTVEADENLRVALDPEHISCVARVESAVDLLERVRRAR